MGPCSGQGTTLVGATGAPCGGGGMALVLRSGSLPAIASSGAARMAWQLAVRTRALARLHVAVLLPALGAGTHRAPDPVLAVVAGLRVHGERQAGGLGQFVDGVEAAIAEVDTVHVDWEHGTDNSISAMLHQPLQFLDSR